MNIHDRVPKGQSVQAASFSSRSLLSSRTTLLEQLYSSCRRPATPLSSRVPPAAGHQTADGPWWSRPETTTSLSRLLTGSAAGAGRGLLYRSVTRRHRPRDGLNRWQKALGRAAQIGRAVAFTASARCHLTRHSHGGPYPSTSRGTVSRNNDKTMEPCLAGDGRLDGRTTTKMNVGREACIESIYVMKLMRMVTIASGGFCPSLDIFNSTFYQILSRE